MSHTIEIDRSVLEQVKFSRLKVRSFFYQHPVEFHFITKKIHKESSALGFGVMLA